jgi:hypothetical protein
MQPANHRLRYSEALNLSPMFTAKHQHVDSNSMITAHSQMQLFFRHLRDVQRGGAEVLRRESAQLDQSKPKFNGAEAINFDTFCSK